MKKIMKKDIVVGLGEIGLPILKLISKKENVVGFDLNKKLMDERLNLTLNIGDPFGLSGFRFETWGDIDEDGIRDWYQDSDRNWSSQTIRLTLEYRFGKMEDRSRYSRQRGDRDGAMDMDSGNMEID